MKLSKTILTYLLVLTPALSAQAATGCEAKRQDIQQQLDYAHKMGNNYRINGLEKALSELNAHCTDERLHAGREAKVKEKELEVKERRQDLEKAQTDGRTEKIAKKQRKLEEAQDKLEAARSMLDK